MSVECFVDTNILVHAVSSAPNETLKRARALEILSEGRFGISAQVLQEFFVTITTKVKAGASARNALAWIGAFEFAPCASTDFDLVRTAIAHSVRYRISYWDAAIIAAAEELKAGILYTEDLNDGQVYGSVKVINPFRNL